MIDIQAKQVAWYRQNGKFKSRIATCRDGKEYVIGDDSWNARIKSKQICPHCNKPMDSAYEKIDDRMRDEINLPA